MACWGNRGACFFLVKRSSCAAAKIWPSCNMHASDSAMIETGYTQNIQFLHISKSLNNTMQGDVVTEKRENYMMKLSNGALVKIHLMLQ
jgi:hypothetical protein